MSLGERGRGVEGRGEGWRQMVEGLGEWVGGRRERQLAVRGEGGGLGERVRSDRGMGGVGRRRGKERVVRRFNSPMR